MTEQFDNIPEEELEGYEEMDDVVTMYDEDNNPVDFQVLDQIPYEGEQYAVLYPLDDDEAKGELVILRLDPSEETETDEVFVSVDDENVLQAVYELFKDAHKDEYDFAD